MAEFRFDQATPGAGITDRSRHDLVPGEVITATVTDPLPGTGISYTWEIIDAVGSTATLDSTTAQVVNIGPAGSIGEPSAFRLRLTVDNNGVIDVVDRIASVRTPITGLRVPIFGETAPPDAKLGLNVPDNSVDNAVYADRAGRGVSEQNWRGWGEWAWELVTLIESLSGGSSPSGPANGDLSGTYPSPLVAGIRGNPIEAVHSPSNGEVLVYNAGEWQAGSVAPGGSATGDLAGTYPSPIVDGLQGRALSNAVPADGQSLVWNLGLLQWEPGGATLSMQSAYDGGPTVVLATGVPIDVTAFTAAEVAITTDGRIATNSGNANGTAGAPHVQVGNGMGMYYDGGTMRLSTASIQRAQLSSIGWRVSGYGAEATPSFSWLGRTDNGLWSPASEVTAISAGGVESVRWNASGQSLHPQGTTALPAIASATYPGIGIYWGLNSMSITHTSGLEVLRFNGGNLKADVGSIVSPGYSFINNAIGMYVPSTNLLGFASNSRAVYVDYDDTIPSFRPDAGDFWNLGEATFRWKTIYATDLDVTNLSVNVDLQGAYDDGGEDIVLTTDLPVTITTTRDDENADKTLILTDDVNVMSFYGDTIDVTGALTGLILTTEGSTAAVFQGSLSGTGDAIANTISVDVDAKTAGDYTLLRLNVVDATPVGGAGRRLLSAQVGGVEQAYITATGNISANAADVTGSITDLQLEIGDGVGMYYSTSAMSFVTAGTKRLELSTGGFKVVGVAGIESLTDAGSKIHWPGAGLVAINATGVETIRWNTSGQSLHADGTESLPAVSALSDPSTGIWFSGPGSMHFGTNGSESFRLNAGTKVVFNDGLVSNTTLVFEGDGTAGWYQPAAGVWGWASASAETFRISADGIQVSHAAAAEGTVNVAELVKLTTTGTGAETADILVGDANPNTQVTSGELGSLFIDATTFGLYQKTGASTWVAFATGGSVTMQGAYDGGKTITTLTGTPLAITTPVGATEDGLTVTSTSGTVSIRGSMVSLPAGSVTIPSLSMITNTNTGFYHIGTGRWGWSSIGGQELELGNGYIRLVDGVLGVPSFSFLNATDSGLWAPTTTTVAVSAGGVEATRWNASGQALHAAGTSGLPPISFVAEPTTGFWNHSSLGTFYAIANGSFAAKFSTSGIMASVSGVVNNPAYSLNNVNSGFYLSGTQDIGFTVESSGQAIMRGDLVSTTLDEVAMEFTPTVNKASGANSYTAMLVNIDASGNLATGTDNRLLDLQVDGTTQAYVTDAGHVRADNGSVTAPGISFAEANRTDQGLRSVSSTQMQIVVGGAAKLSVYTTAIILGTEVNAISGSAANPSYSYANDSSTGTWGGGAASGIFGIATSGIEAISWNSSQQTLHTDGTSGSPSISFASSTNSGFYLAGPTVLPLYLNGVYVAKFSTTGIMTWVSGTAASPSLALQNVSSGFYKESTYNVGITANTVSRAIIRSELNHATNDEVGVQFTPTVNKAAGDYTGLLVNVDTNGGTTAPGTGNLLQDWQVDGTTRASLDDSGFLQLNATDANGSVTNLQLRIRSNMGMYQSGNVGYLVHSGANAMLFTSSVLRAGGNGDAGTPAWGFMSDPDTGTFRDLADNYAISTGGTEAIRWNASQQTLLPTGGLASAPSLSFVTDTDTGIFQPAVGRMDISVNSTTTVIFASSYTRFDKRIRMNAGSVTEPGYALNNDSDTGIYGGGTNSGIFGISSDAGAIATFERVLDELTDEVAIEFTPTVNKVTSGNYTALRVAVSETSIAGSGTDHRLLDLKAGPIGVADAMYVTNIGNVRVGLGTVGVPAYSFVSATGEGLYRPAANQLGLVANNEAVIVDNSDTVPSFRPDDTNTWALGEASFRWDVAYFDAGTEALPSISLRDTDLGLYSHAADGLSLAGNTRHIEANFVTLDFTPDDTDVWDLGTTTKAWGTLYATAVDTGDIHLTSRNDETRYTMVEDARGLFLRNLTTSKSYRIMMEEVPDDEAPRTLKELGVVELAA